MGQTKVDFYYDLISPWSYIAFELLQRYESSWNLKITLRPVILGYIFQAAGNKAPLVVQNKGQMMAQEFRLYSDLYQIPTSPKAWTYSKDARSKPPNSTAIMRFMRLLQDERPDQLAVATDKMFKKVFAEGDHGALFAADKQTLQSLLGQDLFKEEEWDALLEKAKSQQMKDIMKEEGGQIVKDLTAYGVPYMHFTKDDGQTMNFMGSDRFEIIAFWLGKPYQPARKAGEGQQARL